MRAMLRRTVRAVASIALLALAGCGPSWVILGQANPNPLLGQRRFAVQPIDFSGLQVGDRDERGWLAEKDEAFRRDWQSDKAAVNARFLAGIVEGAAERGI